MNKKYKNLPAFLKNKETIKAFEDLLECIPKNIDAYLIGGAARNSFYYDIFKKRMAQRDYDIVVIGKDVKLFQENLLKKNFIYGNTNREDEVVMSKMIKHNSKNIFLNKFILDIHISKIKSIKKNLEQHSNFTINGFAIDLKYILSSDWKKHSTYLDGSLKDLKNKQIRVNSYCHPTLLYAAMRFISKGFKQPTDLEIKKLVELLKTVDKDRHERNIPKLLEYVGGLEKTKKIMNKIGVSEDILDFKKIKKL